MGKVTLNVLHLHVWKYLSGARQQTAVDLVHLVVDIPESFKWLELYRLFLAGRPSRRT